jgi:HEAT repeat protein
VKDLRAAGATVDSVWDLVNARKRKYPELIPVLLDHLGRDYPDRVREGVARALVVKEARVGWRKLVRAYLDEENPPNPEEHANQLKWALHLAIAAAADESVVDELIKLAIDSRHEYHRLEFVEALACMKDPRARATVEELRGEEDLQDVFRGLEKKAKRRLK